MLNLCTDCISYGVNCRQCWADLSFVDFHLPSDNMANILYQQQAQQVFLVLLKLLYRRHQQIRQAKTADWMRASLTCWCAIRLADSLVVQSVNQSKHIYVAQSVANKSEVQHVDNSAAVFSDFCCSVFFVHHSSVTCFSAVFVRVARKNFLSILLATVELVF